MAQLIRAAAAVADYHRQVRNLREASAVNAQLASLSTLQWSGYPAPPAQPTPAQPTPAQPAQDHQRPARFKPSNQPDKTPRTPQRGPGLALPTPLDPRPQTPARPGQERQDRDGGR